MDNYNKPVEDPEIRRCKKCGCELVSTNKHNRCELCRRKRAEAWRHGSEAVVSFVVIAWTAYKNYIANKGATDDSDIDTAYQLDSSGTDEMGSEQSGSSGETV